jgi:signal transduction histidine kinase
VIAAVALAAALDLALVGYVASRLVRSRREGLSLRLRAFFALASAMLVGAALAGGYAELDAVVALGPGAWLARIAPKAFVVGSVLLWFAAVAAAVAGRSLTGSIEQLTLAATRIADGEATASLPRGHEREARQLARALSSLRRELESKPYAASFLRDAWHDLKTPVAAIQATIELLEDGALDDREAARRFLQNLRRSSDQLARTLGDLVTLARFETATLAPDERVTLGALLLDALAEVAPLAEAQHVALALDAAREPDRLRAKGRIRCDPTALARALTNLLENAVAASPGGVVSVVIEESSQGVALELSNQPAEVPAEIRGRLFERTATARKSGGSGLGLAIARAAIEAHGGRVRFVELGPPRVTVRLELPR